MGVERRGRTGPGRSGRCIDPPIGMGTLSVVNYPSDSPTAYGTVTAGSNCPIGGVERRGWGLTQWVWSSMNRMNLGDLFAA